MAGDIDPGLADVFGRNAAHGSPLFDFLTSFAPRKLKDLLKLCEFLYFNSSQIYAALQKFAIYPVTEINYASTNESLKKKYKHLHDRVLKTKRILIRGAIDKYVYGNAFFSVYSPFVRFLKCSRCSHMTNIRAVEYKFRLKKLEFIYQCSSCKHRGPGQVIDQRINRPDMIKIIRWDPKLMDIDHNTITGHSEYFWTIPAEMKDKVRKGNKHLLNTMPMEFLKTLRDDKLFKFAEGQLFHIKMDAPAGIEAHWGFPPLASTVKLFFYAAVLRKANEAIALDYVVPFRIISPRQASGAADPVLTISLARWSSDMKSNIRKWRRDPLHIMWSPIPAEVTHVGGQARALMTLGEVQAAEENIITALGIPKEFIIGGLSFTGSAITLRILENQLMAHTTDLIELLQWISDKSGRLLGWERIECSLAPFKFLDDVQQKQLLLQLNQNPQAPMVSNTTLADLFDIDIAEEREKRMQEQLDEIRFNQDLQDKIAKMQNTLAQQVQAQIAQGQQPAQYDQQKVIGEADQIVQQLMGMDEGSRRSTLHQLQIEDYVLYSVAVNRLHDQQTVQNRQALVAAKGGGGNDGGGGGAPPVATAA